MRYLYRFPLLLVPILVLFLCGCSSRPTDQIARTEKAMEQAKAEHADEFVPDDWRTAEKAWNDAQARLELKKYTEATTLLLKAQKGFERARDLSKGKREALIAEIKGKQTAIELRCKRFMEGVEASGKKLTAAQKKELAEICKDIEERVAKITIQLEQDQYNDAKYLAGTTLREVYEAEVKLNDYTGKKKA